MLWLSSHLHPNSREMERKGNEERGNAGGGREEPSRQSGPPKHCCDLAPPTPSACPMGVSGQSGPQPFVRRLVLYRVGEAARVQFRSCTPWERSPRVLSCPLFVSVASLGFFFFSRRMSGTRQESGPTLLTCRGISVLSFRVYFCLLNHQVVHTPVVLPHPSPQPAPPHRTPPPPIYRLLPVGCDRAGYSRSRIGSCFFSSISKVRRSCGHLERRRRLCVVCTVCAVSLKHV